MTMYRSAVISECGQYRYLLTRSWDHEKPVLGFIMLNPSTADASFDDPTVRECVSLANRWGYGGIMIGNLFAYRSSSPHKLKLVSDPVGPQNEMYLRKVLANNTVVLAWGTKGGLNKQNEKTIDFIKAVRFGDLSGIKCLGRTRDKHPRHPLGTVGNPTLENFWK